MKYMILTFASQQQYQDMVGQPAEQPAWTQADWAALAQRDARRVHRQVLIVQYK